MSVEKLVSSMVVAFDGPSKCGKTTYAEAVAEEARFQKRFYEGREIDDDWPYAEQLRAKVADWAESITFNHISTISAGNIYRAAALYVITQEEFGNEITSFSETDVDRLRELLAEDDVIDVLQNDPEVGRRVSPTAKFAGAQALCGTLFCDYLLDAYERDGGSNLVVVDARDPLGHMRRNNLLGEGTHQIAPTSVIPLYIDTPIQVAASRMKGSLEDNVEIVRSRRHDDANRAELPVSPPEILVENFRDWVTDVSRNSDGYIPTHYLAKNGENITLDNIQYLASLVSLAAHNRAYFINRSPLQN